MRIALYQPDIAGNVGAVLRTAACLGAGVDLIEPMGFQWDDRRVARAGMDYIDHVAVTRHADWDSFAARADGRLVLLTTRGATPLHDFTFTPDDVRFTSKGGTLYMAMLKWPDRPVTVPVLHSIRIARATLVGGGPVTVATGGAGPSFTLPPPGVGDIVPVVALEGPGLV